MHDFHVSRQRVLSYVERRPQYANQGFSSVNLKRLLGISNNLKKRFSFQVYLPLFVRKGLGIPEPAVGIQPHYGTIA